MHLALCLRVNLAVAIPALSETSEVSVEACETSLSDKVHAYSLFHLLLTSRRIDDLTSLSRHSSGCATSFLRGVTCR